jgi:hypothetical protein
MRIGIVVASALTVALAGAGPAVAKDICKVTDPTGTPLNVRTAPGGEILGTIGNGRDVEVLETRDDARGKAWVLIRQPGAGAAMGWVFREFVSCYR